MTRQDKPRQNMPSVLPLPPLPPRQQDRLRLCTIFTFFLQTFHKRPYSCHLSFIRRHLYLPCLCSVCYAVTVHTHATNNYSHLHPDSETSRQTKLKRLSEKEGMKAHPFYMGILTMSFISISPLTFPPNFHPPSHHCHHDATKHEGKAYGEEGFLSDWNSQSD